MSIYTAYLILGIVLGCSLFAGVIVSVQEKKKKGSSDEAVIIRILEATREFEPINVVSNVQPNYDVPIFVASESVKQ